MDNVAYYCLDRGNGQFTPLIPLDQLPVDILGLPARVASDENMIILPEPRLPGDVANNQALAMLVDLAVTVSSSRVPPSQLDLFTYFPFPLHTCHLEARM